MPSAFLPVNCWATVNKGFLVPLFLVAASTTSLVRLQLCIRLRASPLGQTRTSLLWSKSTQGGENPFQINRSPLPHLPVLLLAAPHYTRTHARTHTYTRTHAHATRIHARVHVCTPSLLPSLLRLSLSLSHRLTPLFHPSFPPSPLEGGQCLLGAAKPPGATQDLHVLHLGLAWTSAFPGSAQPETVKVSQQGGSASAQTQLWSSHGLLSNSSLQSELLGWRDP